MLFVKKVIISLSIAILISVCAIIYFIASYLLQGEDSNELSENKEIQEVDVERERVAISGAVTDEKLAEYEDEELNPFGEAIRASDLTDGQIQEYIHGMSHQKIIAEAKWGFYGIHPSRITWLLEALDMGLDVEHKTIYKEILVKWDKGDFSMVDDDHNVIWNLQGGTIGKATGIMSEEEEKEYIESQK